MITTINRLLQEVESHARLHVHLYGAYLQVWYYVEILYLMGILLVLYGKGLAFMWGIVLAVLLSIHIIRFYFRQETSRRVQLVLMDLHVAYSASMLVAFIQGTPVNNLLETGIMLARLLVVLIELYMIWLLTDDSIKKNFGKLDHL